MAPVGRMCPDPNMKGVAGAKIGEPPSSMMFIVLSRILAEVIMADLMAAGLHFGWRALRRPTMPETWGQDIEVPDIVMYGTVLLSNGSPVGLTAPENAAIMFTPGAVTSGCKELETHELCS